MESTATIISIDRGQPFNPVRFLDEGWTIEEEDECSLVLTQVDLAKVRFEHMLKPGERYIKGEERLRRLKEAGYVRLDAAVFQMLWDNKELIPKSWKKKGTVCFDGTVFRGGPFGDRCVFYLNWYSGQWDWYYRWLGDDWDVNEPSAVLASV